jgi:MFS family permease
MMAICCVVMATLPTYAQVGIYASWAITACRVVQGISSMGEIIGAELYLSELIKRPASYPAVCLILCASNFGAIVALAIATMVLFLNVGWRTAFWIGAGIAAIGFVARAALRETPEFVDALRRIKKKYEKANFDQDTLRKTINMDPIVNEKVNQKTSLAYFLIKCARPVCFYFTYIYCGNILKQSLHYTAEQVVQHNLIVSIVDFLITVGLTYLSCKIYPLKIVKIKTIIFSIGILLCPYLLSKINTPLQLFLIQVFVCLFYIGAAPADAILFGYFPVFKRFTYSSFIHALSRTLTYIITSFGLAYLTDQFNYWGLLIIFVPVTIGFSIGILHFEKLEKEAGNYPQKLPMVLEQQATH